MQCVEIIDEKEKVDTNYASRPIAVVEKIVSTVNDDNVKVNRLYVMMNGKVESYLAEEALVLEKSTKEGKKPLTRGDVLIFSLNDKGEIRRFNVLMDSGSIYAGANETWFHPDTGITKTMALIDFNAPYHSI